MLKHFKITLFTFSNAIFFDKGIARTVEIHQPLIETYYGPGRLTHVLTMLQNECDAQANRIFIEFKKKREIKDKVDEVRDATYGTVSISNTSSMTGSYSSDISNSAKLEARDLHHILEEMALLQARSEMYFKFIRKKAFTDIDLSKNNEESKEAEEKKKNLERQLLTCGLSQSVQDIMSQYILLEEFYMTQNIRKAAEQHKDSLTDINDDKLLDDVFFIVRQCVTRAAGCGKLFDGMNFNLFHIYF